MRGRAGIVALLFTDLANSRERLERAGDEATQGLLRAHYRLLQTAVGMGGDREVQWLGDGWLVAFGAAVDAVRCAIAMQQAAQRRNVGTRLAVRVGLVGGGGGQTDYLGTPVLIARQLCDLAQGGRSCAPTSWRILELR
jgi:class 3 adenylate cyclase